MSTRTCPANQADHILYRWTDGNGDEWACAAYDHGPFCRLCSLVADDHMADQLAAVEAGRAEVHTANDGTLVFRERS